MIVTQRGSFWCQLVVMADLISPVVIASAELPIGIVAAVIGSPVFL